jgi:hypothetical protein
MADSSLFGKKKKKGKKGKKKKKGANNATVIDDSIYDDSEMSLL